MLEDVSIRKASKHEVDGVPSNPITTVSKVLTRLDSL